MQTFHELNAYSLAHRSQFWSDVFSASNLIHSGTATVSVDESQPIDAVPRWFQGTSLNFAENALFSSSGGGVAGTEGKEDAKIAITEVREGGSAVRHVSWRELRQRAGRAAAAMQAKGVRRGDRVVVVGANSVETAVVLLATTWVGAVFSSSSTDMGVKGILQRTVQVNPKVSFILYDFRRFYIESWILTGS